VAAADQPLSHFFSTDVVTSAESDAYAAPLTEQPAPGSEVFHALREVGNVGSHGSGVRREVVLTAFEIYEHQLDILFRPNSGLRIETLAKRIRATKGK
jgi:hypothetical protein